MGAGNVARLEGQREAERKGPKIVVEKLHTPSTSLAVFRDGRVEKTESIWVVLARNLDWELWE